jgi:hypothetical protein
MRLSARVQLSLPLGPWTLAGMPRMLLAAVLGLIAPAGRTAAPPAGGPQIRTNTPIRNFSLPSFNEKGFRTMLVRGREATLLGKTEATLSDMTLTIFSGDEAARVETVFLSTAAVVRSDERIIHGDESVRVINDDFELLGKDWRYEHDLRKINIRQGARVVFKAELKDILK